MLSGTLGNWAKCSGIRNMRARCLLLQVAGTKAAACSRPIRLMGEAWKEGGGVAGRQRAKRHPWCHFIITSCKSTSCNSCRYLLWHIAHFISEQWTPFPIFRLHPLIFCLWKVGNAKEIRHGYVFFLEIFPGNLQTHIITKWNVHK